MKTIKKIAEEIGVSKMAVQKRLARSPFKEKIEAHITIENGAKMIDADGERIIKAAYDMDKPIDKGIDTMDKSIDTATDKTIDTLIKQLEIKDKQILDLSTALVAAQQTAAAAQALHAGTMQTQLLTDKEVKKPRWWQGLFKRQG
jgi:hypothetical protein